jgi:hypothetical protein
MGAAVHRGVLAGMLDFQALLDADYELHAISTACVCKSDEFMSASDKVPNTKYKKPSNCHGAE